MNAKRKPVKKVKEKNVVSKRSAPVKRPSTGQEVVDFDFESLAKEHKLTDLQTKFAYYYVFVTGLNGPQAAEFAGYSPGNYDDKDYDDKTKEYYKGLVFRNMAKNLLDNPKVLTLITRLRDELSNQLIVDKLYVLQNLKRLAETGTSENIQLRALEKLGETMELFKTTTVVEEREDPARLAAEAFERRMAAEKNKTVDFKKEG